MRAKGAYGFIFRPAVAIYFVYPFSIWHEESVRLLFFATNYYSSDHIY